MPDVILLILGCAFVTYLTRISGHLVLSRFGVVHHRLEAALTAVPTAVLTALVAPAVITTGIAEMLSVFVAILFALRFSLMISVTAGLSTVVFLRLLI